MEKSLSWPRDRVLLSAGSILIVGSFVLGGAPERFPVPEIILFILSVSVLSILAWSERYRNLAADCMEKRPVRAAMVLGGLFIALLVLQLLPLPSWLVGILPGRALLKQSLAMADCASCWSPLSVSPELTMRTLASLAAPLAMFTIGIMSGRRSLRLLVWVTVAVVGLNAVVGVVQAGTEGNWGRFYDSPHLGSALGFFRNRNHMAIACVAMIPLLFARFSQMHLKRERRWTFEVITVGLLLVVVVATKSRTGVALAAFTTLASIALFYRLRLTLPRMLAGGGAVIVLGFLAYGSSGALGDTAARFTQVGDDFRWVIWPASVRVLAVYNWAGVGAGGFVPAYNANEQLGDVYAAYANAAHNDYLQFVIENGIFGAALLLLVLGALIYAVVRFVAGGVDDKERDDCVAAFMVTFLLAFHSFFDYPLRTGAMAAVAALMAGVIARSIRVEQRRARWEAPKSVHGLSSASDSLSA